MRKATMLLPLLAVMTACQSSPDQPLTIAAAAGRTAEVRDLLASGTDPDLVDGAALTPLAWAARNGQLSTIEALLEAGADPEQPAGSSGWTPLVHAIHKGRNEAARALLDGGALSSGPSGRRALRMAAGYGNAEMVRELLGRGANPRAEPALLRDAVGGAPDIDYAWSGCEGHTEAVQAILEVAPDLALGDGFWDRRARARARRKGCAELVRLVAPRES